MINYTYKSIFAPYFESFISIKHAMGFTTEKIEYTFKELDLTAHELKPDEPILTKEIVAEWRKGRVNDRERTLYDKWSIIGQFSRYLCHCGFISYVPPMPRQKDKRFVPKIFTTEEIAKLFESADRLRVSATGGKRNAMFSIPALLRVLYATGMRIGEALRLTNAEVNLEKGLITIRKSKNQRQRLIPIAPSLMGVLKQYVENRAKMPLQKLKHDESVFFITYTGEQISVCVAYNWFRKVLKAAGIPFIGDRRGPRVHDLRHTFAVHSLMKQVRAGRDIYCLLPILSVLMGHKTLAGTEYYVRLTNEMFPELNIQIGELSSYVFPSLEKIIRENEE